jgi:hypothetical protein
MQQNYAASQGFPALLLPDWTANPDSRPVGLDNPEGTRDCGVA